MDDEEKIWLETSNFPFDQQSESLRELGHVDVRVTPRGEVWLGDRKVNHPILQDGITAERRSSQHHILTLKIVVGSVTFETKERSTSEPPA